MSTNYTFDFCGSPVSFHYKRITPLANSSVFATWGESSVNVSVLRGKSREGTDFFPLLVEYIEKWYAAGKIASSPYVKREGFPSDNAILRGRIIDRALRPRFPKDLIDDVQVFINVLSYDIEHDPLLLGFNTAVAALMASDIPFEGELAGVRISQKDAGYFINPHDVTALSDSAKKIQADMNMVIALDKQGIVMFDADYSEIAEDKIVEGLEYARVEAEKIYTAQREFAAMVNTQKKDGAMFVIPEEVVNFVTETQKENIISALGSQVKEERKAQDDAILEATKEKFSENEEVSDAHINGAIAKVSKKIVLKSVLEDGRRIDNRQFDEIRNLSAEVGLIPKVHGSSIFRRGDTHVMSIVTIDAPTKNQSLDDITGEDSKTYIHEYLAPPASYGETGRYSNHPGRREIGHGALAEKAVEKVLPGQDVFPYMIRVVSEVVSSSGSTSMAATCASTLALMDAGVPIKKPVAGISIGVIADDEFEKYQILTDIVETEDFYGYMDFKVTGTYEGVTAIQMDQKKLRIPYKVIYEALIEAKKAREKILAVMASVIDTPRAEVSKLAPRVDRIKIDPDNIGKLIGPGGKTIKEITAKTGMEINIKEDGTVEIFGTGQEDRDKARQLIEDLFGEFTVGEIYDAEVIGIKPFGAIVKLFKGNMEGEGLVHISEISDTFVKDINDVIKLGDKVKIKLVGVEDNGKLRLSIKQAK